jgi:probable phosphoglycerate mutase
MTTSRTEFVIIRHGQTHGNITRTLQGQSNTDLDETGVQQVRLLARRLKSHPAFEAVISSDLKRARDTAQILVDSIGGTIIPNAGLREWNLGILEGRSWQDLQLEYPQIMNSFLNSHKDVEVPGGERRSVMEKRVSECLDTLASEFAGKRLLVVTHGGVLRAIFRHIVGLPAGNNMLPQTSNASYNSCTCTNGIWQLTCWNDTAHLNPALLYELITF